jgi:hypothetical protein
VPAGEQDRRICHIVTRNKLIASPVCSLATPAACNIARGDAANWNRKIGEAPKARGSKQEGSGKGQSPSLKKLTFLV